ncbi:MAG TPA: hypothetical protein VL860_05060, partial [Planctomycetota bacterium]|nr:hypothetical protein [Planctomycetota bacterium]
KSTILKIETAAGLLDYVRPFKGILPFGYVQQYGPTLGSHGTNTQYYRIVFDKSTLPAERMQSKETPDEPEKLAQVLLIRKEVFEKYLEEEESFKKDKNLFSKIALLRSFVYFDISEFSQSIPFDQLNIIHRLIYITSRPLLWQTSKDDDLNKVQQRIFGIHAKADLEAKLCIGDGYIFVFRTPVLAAYFSCFLAMLIEKCHEDIHFRMGVHTGLVYRFWDPGRNGPNYIGDGINGGQRILSAVGKELDDVIFVSKQVREALLGFGEEDRKLKMQLLSCMDNKGRKKDKHGNSWRVYQLNHLSLIQTCKLFEQIDANQYEDESASFYEGAEDELNASQNAQPSPGDTV